MSTSSGSISHKAATAEVRGIDGEGDRDLCRVQIRAYASNSVTEEFVSVQSDIWGTPEELFAFARAVDRAVAELVCADAGVPLDGAAFHPEVIFEAAKVPGFLGRDTLGQPCQNSCGRVVDVHNPDDPGLCSQCVRAFEQHADDVRGTDPRDAETCAKLGTCRRHGVAMGPNGVLGALVDDCGGR